MRGPVEHVRRSNPPWRSDFLTECGHEESEFAVVITRDEFLRKVKDLGMQRVAMTTCMTCFNTARNHGDWKTDPVGVLTRDTWGKREEQLTLELRALELLYVAHQEEYEETLQALQAATPIRPAKRVPGFRTI